MALEKIRAVYELAKRVLVLDAGLMCIEARSVDITEGSARIFTSAWMRRLWTLQEGALAKSLYFQFADQAVGLQDLYQSFVATKNIRYQVFREDLQVEVWTLGAFFHSGEKWVPSGLRNLHFLDKSLHYREVSMPEDEPLCIAMLMDLDMAQVLYAGKDQEREEEEESTARIEERREKRMQKVWELLALKDSGIPSAIIFVEDGRLSSPGWRWALRSFLKGDQNMIDEGHRTFRWSSQGRGTIDSHGRGLKVQYQGQRISVVNYNDQKPRNPWPGVRRTKESGNQDVATGRWYQIARKRDTYLQQRMTEDEYAQYTKDKGFPLHNLLDTNKMFLIIGKVSDQVSEGILASIAPEQNIESDDGIAVIIMEHVSVGVLQSDSGYIYETIRNLALVLRNDEITDKHLHIYDQLVKRAEASGADLETQMKADDEFVASVKQLEQKMQDTIRELVNKDQRFVDAVRDYWTEKHLEYLWVAIGDYFHHNYTGNSTNPEQVWYVD